MPMPNREKEPIAKHFLLARMITSVLSCPVLGMCPDVGETWPLELRSVGEISVVQDMKINPIEDSTSCSSLLARRLRSFRPCPLLPERAHLVCTQCTMLDIKEITTTNQYDCGCERCGHIWQTTGDAPPLRCAGCKSPLLECR